MIKRVSRILLLLGLLASLPVMAIDYHHSRTDGIQVVGTSVGQQSSNQAFNIFDSLLDAAASNFALYWMGELQESGGQTTAPFGDYPPTAVLQDNRAQDDDVDWTTWQVVSTKTLGATMTPPARPIFTPNIPQAWSPVEFDLDQGTVGPDHFIVGVSFEPTTIAGSATNLREQILNAYYPQTAAGLPGNDPMNTTGPMGRQKGTVVPFWKRASNGLPGLRIRDLEPVRTQSASVTDPGVGVVTQPLIAARVPATYKGMNGTTSETLPVVYLVVGTGENGDYAHVICVSLKRPLGSTDATLPDWLPDVTAGTGSNILTQVEPPDPDNFNPNTGGGGSVMWSYRVQDAAGNPMPVAGISFANIGTTADSQPLLFVTASKFDPLTGKPSDGKVICLNAKAADILDTSDDGDPRAGQVRWQYTNPAFTPTSTGVAEVPGFWYGMAPAVCRVPLTNVFPGKSGDESEFTISRAMKSHDVTEWEVFVADSVGIFRAFEAGGKPLPSQTQISSWQELVRWQDLPTAAGNPEYRMDRQAVPAVEKFVVPPLVYQGNTPLKTDNGALVAGSTDVGFDDEVIFASEKGTIYSLDAVGRFVVNRGSAANDGTPTGLTDTRWTWPDNDTAFTPAAPMTGDADEPRVWPRQLGDPNSTTWYPKTATPISRQLGTAVPLDDTYLCRSPLAVTLGANTNPNGFSPNLDDGDDVIFVPYLHSQGLAGSVPDRRRFYEYIGSLKPYGFVQASRPISQLTKIEVTIGGQTREIPLDHVRVGSVKSNGVSSTETATILAPSSLAGQANPNFAAGITAQDTIYVVSPTWYDEANDEYVQLPPSGVQLILTYDAPTSATNTAPQAVTESVDYPSCYRLDYPDAVAGSIDFTAPIIRRSRASLSVDYNRLEQRRVRRASGVATVTDELPAEIDASLVDTYGWRPAAMMASGSASTNGTLMAPTWFRGRIIAFSNRLLTQRVILGNYDPRIDPAIGGTAATPYGPVGREFRYDPGVFFADFLDDEPLVTDVGGSVVLVDGWAYVMYRNGHFRAFSNVGGGAAGTQYYPPIFYPPASPNNGNLVRAPFHDATDPQRGIHISKVPAVASDPIQATNTANYLDISGTLDQSVMLEMGQMVYIIVDFGPSSELTDPQTIDPNAPPTAGASEIDMQVLQYEVQAQLRSSNGAVQQLPGIGRGVRPTVQNGRIVAVVPVFTGVPSATNPLTPGTPLLWERQPAEFTGEVTFDIQVTQQGVQWRWPGGESQDGGGNWISNPNKQHFWENERNTGAVRFSTTAGTTDGMPAGDPPTTAKWSWANEWAPLFTYNNPIMVGYDPDGVNGNGYYGIVSPAGSVDLLGRVDYTTRNQAGRKNGDVYIANSVDGSRSGSGQPVIPVVGAAAVGSAANSPLKQLLFAAHGTSSAPSSTNFPELAKIRVGDRSFLAVAGRNLTLRIQPAPLTKMGVGALFGRTASGDTTLANLSATGPAGSFEQNVGSLDDGPDGAYASIPENRIVVTKDGTNLNLVTSPIQVPGRDQNGVLPQFAALETLAVQVDVPRYTADDLYSTRWRTAGQFGANPLPISAGGSTFNPFFTNGTYAGMPARPIRDRAEKFAKGPTTSAQGPNPATGEDPGPASTTFEPAAGNPNYDDRLRRVVIYNDANNNGQLDLLPTYREAYRTFAVQVGVKPELKLDVSQQVLDLGAVWHGKKQPGLTGGGANEIREWQRMNLMAASAVGADANVAAFYRQYWRQFNIYNLGNVNLSVVKPEVAYQSATSGLQLVGLPSEGNDPWRALSLLAGLTAVNGGPNPLTDPYQIFLRTSFDDQLLPDNNAYGSGGRGVWLQKAPAGSSQPGAVAYAEKVAAANTLGRDPTNRTGGALTAEPRETWMTLNIPTGAALGQYSGSLRFYNDRTVAFKEDLTNSPVGYRYERPTGLPAASVGNGVLERDPTGEPLEPASDSPLRIKAKITENLVHGRYQTADGTKDPQDRRMQPAAIGYTSPAAQGTVQSIVLAYAGNRFGVGSNQPAIYDLFGTQLKFDTGRFLFPFDELPLDRAPWADLTGGAYGWTNFTTATTGSKISRPSVVQDINGVGVMAWTEQQTLGGGNDLFRIFYQGLSATPAPILLQPGGQPPDPRIQRSGVRMFSAQVGPTNNWLAIYAAGNSTRRNLMYTTTTADPTQAASSNQWSFENLLATSSALTSVNDPSVFTTDAWPRPAAVTTTVAADVSTVPAMAVVAYTGSNSRLGRSDVYVSRYRIAALTTAGQRGAANQQGRDQDFAQVSFPRTEGDLLKPDASRTTYISGGLDFLIPTAAVATIPTVGPGPVQLYLARPDVAFGAAAIGATGRNGSLAQPLPLIQPSQVALGQTPQGELVFGLNPQLIAVATGAAQQQLQTVKILIDRSAGVFRLSMDARRLAALVLTTPAMTPASPDPVLSADYTAATMRITRGDVSATDAVIVPVMAKQGQPAIYDASWYKQQLTPNAWATGSPIPGRADRLWVLWRRTAGAVAGGPTTFYKVLRPGIRVRAGQITSISPAALTFNPTVTPEEVNASEGTIFFPLEYEGQRITVTYAGPGGGAYSESHVVGWQDETGERPLPMENSVNEGTLDAFASYEDATMQGGSVRKMERMWVFWSSTRNSGGDLYYATLAPRIGGDVNVQGSVNYSASGAAGPAALSRLSPTSARATLQQFALYERRHPFVVPRVTRRGPYMPTRATGLRPARR